MRRLTGVCCELALGLVAMAAAALALPAGSPRGPGGIGSRWERGGPGDGPRRIELTGAVALASGVRLWRYRALDGASERGLIAPADLTVRFRRVG